MSDYAAQPALEMYNKIFETSISGDFEGYLVVNVAGGTMKIFASGNVVMLIPNDPKKHPISYPTPEHIDDLKEEMTRLSELEDT